MDYIRLISEALDDDKDKEDVHPKGSKLNNEIALDALKIVRDELNRLGCQLVDYYISFTAAGFDITKIKIKCDDPSVVLNALKEAEPEVRHEFSHSPTKYAYTAANVEIARRIQDELGLDYEAMTFEDSDAINVSISEPKEEKPLPQSEVPAPDAIAAGMEGDFTPIEGEPGLEDVEAATGGGGGGGGLGAMLGGGGGGGGLGGAPGGEESLEGGPGGPLGGGEPGEEGAEEGEEGAPGEGGALEPGEAPGEGAPEEGGPGGPEGAGEGEEGAPEAGEEPEEEGAPPAKKAKKLRPGAEF